MVNSKLCETKIQSLRDAKSPEISRNRAKIFWDPRFWRNYSMPRPLYDKRFVPCNWKVIQIPETFCLWNPESWALESGNSSRNPESRYNAWKPESKFHWQFHWSEIHHLESGILSIESRIHHLEWGIHHLEFGIHHLESGIWNPSPGIWNPQHRIQNPRLSWIPLHGAKLYSIH